MDLLGLEEVTKRFGDFTALDRLTLQLPARRLTAVIGPNGAGKTTLINIATGALTPDSGKVRFRGEAITRVPVHSRVRRGHSRSFQIMNVFARLSVLQNLLVPVLARRGQRRQSVPCARAGARSGRRGAGNRWQRSACSISRPEPGRRAVAR